MRRILLVENRAGHAKRLERELRQAGYAPTVASGAGPGLEAIEQDDFELILAPPARGGLDLLKDLRAKGNKTPVILIADRADKDERARGLGLGADDYLTRPFGDGELLSRIRAARRVRVLNSAIRAASRNLDRREALVAIVDRVLALTGSERGLVLIEDKDGRLRRVVARERGGRDLAADARYSRSIARRVLATGEAEALLDAPGWRQGSVADLKLRHVLCAPTTKGRKRRGVLYADSRDRARGFTRSDLAVFETLAAQCGAVVETANLRHAYRKKKASLEAARQVQQALLPRRPVKGGCVEVAGLARPCEETGGDYYDFIPLEGDRLALALGDVSGHGVGAAMLMTAARSLLRAFLPRCGTPAEALAEVNGSLVSDMPVESFMTLFVGELDRRTGALRYASAGHNDALVCRPGEDGCVELGPTGPALGLVTTSEYRLEETAPLGEGDLLLLYTDGLTEATSPKHGLFGLERLKALLKSLHDRSAPEIVSAVTGAVARFTGGPRPADDCTVVVAKGIGR